MKKTLFPVLAILCLSGCQTSDAPREAKFIAVQHNGQVKSFESFARQTVELVCERDHWGDKSALATLLEALSGSAGTMRWIRIEHRPLKHQLSLDPNRTLFSFQELSGIYGRVAGIAKDAKKKRDSDIRPSLFEQKAESLYTKMSQVDRLAALETVRVAPPASGDEWISPADTPFGRPFLHLLESHAEKRPAFTKEVADWVRATELKTGGRYSKKIRMEVLYHELKPFHWAWVLYLAAFVLISVRKKGRGRRAGVVLAVAAFLLHTLGLGLRVAILGRPPVSNMFESVVYMNWIVMIAAFVFAAARRQAAPVSVGALLSAVVMIYADLLPFDASLEVLVPVLRSNYWLSVHVMTIVSSYGVLGLAMGLGHRHLILAARKKLGKKEEENSKKLIYRTIQVGSLLLGIGTTLGGVWANESWGRFWGWDPKETWALITFLGYLILIHLVHFQRIGAFALAVSSIVAFQLVLMTWYGVNFVLGRGLHSYGFGSGGTSWIVFYLACEALFLAFIFLKQRRIEPN